MKPSYIFTAVIAVSILMVGLLPQLGHATIASAPAGGEPTVEPLPIVTVNPPAAAEPQATEGGQPTPTTEAGATSGIAVLGGSTPANEPSAINLPADAGDDFRNFVRSVRNNDQGSVVGVYAPGLFGMPVTGQPGGDENYISADENVLTQYSTPTRYGVIAVLAHNYLNSGKLLSKITPNQEVFIVYGDGKVARYRVSTVQYFQALSPHDVRSDFRDLNGPGSEVISYDQLFNEVYTKSRRLVFQTCLEANGDLSWGRIFISADPAS